MKNLMFVLIALIVAGFSMEAIAQKNTTIADNNAIVKMKKSKKAFKVNNEEARKARKARKHIIKMKKAKMQRAKATKFMSHPQINVRPAEKAVMKKIRKDKINKLRNGAE
ncbi:MAG: hypothetical protein HKN92_06170 [Chitinophagales bacterium]|nr:hypothetical protein [Chitinophagales bacterium]